MKLDFLDGRPNGLLELFETSRNPFGNARSCLAAELRRCSQETSGLRVLTAAIIGTHDLEDMVSRFRSVNVEFQAQIWFRFLKYENSPLTLFSVAHPGVTDETSKKVFRDALCRRPCCQDKGPNISKHVFWGNGLERLVSNQISNMFCHFVL